MVIICNKPKGSCTKCKHYRKDEDYYNGTIKCCWLKYDLKHCINKNNQEKSEEKKNA